MEPEIRLLKTTLTPARCSLDLGDGSERGEYVSQDYIISKLGRPHRSIGLMYCYYPFDVGWPKRASVAFESTDTMNAWGYPYDDYFPYQIGPVYSEEREPFNCIRDIRRHGQDVNLTLTMDCAIPEEHLVQIARDLRPFGRLRLRINHECTGTWFQFNKRYSYQEVADFFVRAHTTIKNEAPNIDTILCCGGIEDDSEKLEYEKELTEAIRIADAWSNDCYLSLHWGWPCSIAESFHNNHKLTHINEVHENNKRAYERFIKVNNGEAKPFMMAEFNADGDVCGGEGQAKRIEAFFQQVESGEYDFYDAITMYQFRDRGRLGLEQEDPNNAENGIEQPLFQTYKDIIARSHFSPSIESSESVSLPYTMRWGGADDAEGITFELDLASKPVFFEIYFYENINLMIEVNGKWFYKAPKTELVDLMPAFWNKEYPGEKIKINIFGPPGAGTNANSSNHDWAVNYYQTITKLPDVRIRYQPVREAIDLK